MAIKGPHVGGDVDSMCTRCKLLLTHTIVAMVGERIARVKCNTCGSEHRYLPASPERPGRAGTRPARQSRATGGKRTTGGARAGTARASDYEQLMQGRDISQPHRYRATESFEKNEVVDHPTFGIGLVTAIKGPDKVEILFPDGPKLLIQGRG